MALMGATISGLMALRSLISPSSVVMSAPLKAAKGKRNFNSSASPTIERGGRELASDKAMSD